MSTLSIHLELDNDAFSGDDITTETARILRWLALKLDGMTRSDLDDVEFTPKDLNGNKVGYIDFVVDDEEEDEDASTRSAAVHEYICSLKSSEIDRCLRYLGLDDGRVISVIDAARKVVDEMLYQEIDIKDIKDYLSEEEESDAE